MVTKGISCTHRSWRQRIPPHTTSVTEHTRKIFSLAREASKVYNLDIRRELGGLILQQSGLCMLIYLSLCIFSTTLLKQILVNRRYKTSLRFSSVQ